MKTIYIILLITLCSCAQSKKEETLATFFSEETLIKDAIKTLGIDTTKTDFVSSKVSRSNPEDIIIIIPEVINEDEGVDELNGNIIIANNITGKQTHTFFESPEENGWTSGAVFIDNITIDTLAYSLSNVDNAFGIITSFRGSSQPNPYNAQNISLYAKEGKSLKKVLDKYTIDEYFGEVNVSVDACYADFKNTVNRLSISDTITNGFNDILVKSTLSQIQYSKDEDGECNPNEKVISVNDIVLKFNGVEYKEATRTPVNITSILDFNTAIAALEVKTLPQIEATNYDSFIDEDDYNNVDVQALKLESIYPNFYKQGYNYRAVASYKVNLSDAFHSVVITVLKGDNEMESILINYDFDGNIIDSVVVSYDEIAEGMFRKESKLTSLIITSNQIAWYEEPQIEQVNYQILSDGTIETLDSKILNDELSNLPIINIALKKLKLNLLNVKTEFIKTKTHPDNPDDFIVTIPEIIEEEENYVAYNCHIFVINGRSGEVIQKSVINGLTSETGEVIKSIKIDTGPYLVNENTHAFGILIYRYGDEVMLFENESLELFVKSGDTLSDVLRNFSIMDYGGESVNECEGEYTRNTSVLKPQTTKTNGYFDILVETEIVDTESFLDKDGVCNATEKHSTQTKLLKYNGESYN